MSPAESSRVAYDHLPTNGLYPCPSLCGAPMAPSESSIFPVLQTIQAKDLKPGRSPTPTQDQQPAEGCISDTPRQRREKDLAASEQQCRLGDKTSPQTGVGGKIRKDSLELSLGAMALKSLLSQGVNPEPCWGVLVVELFAG